MGGEKVGFVPQPTEETRIDHASIAYGYFIRASIECPASITAQAAKIALWCKRSGYTPWNLGLALSTDAAKIEKLVEVAKSAHEVRGRKFEEPKIEDVARIIGSDFFIADSMMILDDEQLETISTEMYQQYHAMNLRSTVNGREIVTLGGEDKFSFQVDSMISSKNMSNLAKRRWSQRAEKPKGLLRKLLSR